MGYPRISFKTIVPKKGFLFNIFAEEIQRAMRFRSKPALRGMFYKTVENWETPVYFRGTIRTIAGQSIRLLVKPYGKGASLYNLVARGASPHPIKAKNADYLQFQPGYFPATQPGWIGSKRKRRFGPVIYREEVQHPGFEARNFDIEIAQAYGPKFVEEMSDAVERYRQRQERAFNAINRTERYTPVDRQ